MMPSEHANVRTQLLVGPQSDRYPMTVAGEMAEPPMREIYVRPALRLSDRHEDGWETAKSRVSDFVDAHERLVMTLTAIGIVALAALGYAVIYFFEVARVG